MSATRCQWNPDKECPVGYAELCASEFQSQAETLEERCSAYRAEREAARDDCERRSAECNALHAQVSAMREALMVVVDWIPDVDHHRDECPGDCEGHASRWVIDKALAPTAGADWEARVRAAERERLAQALELEADASAGPNTTNDAVEETLREAAAFVRDYSEGDIDEHARRIADSLRGGKP